MAPPEHSASTTPDPLGIVAPVLLAVLGVGFSLSVFAGGFYDSMVWSPIALGLLALLLGLLVGVPARPRGMAAAALAALGALWLWSWVSASWAESDEQSHLATARWAMYAALFAVLLILLREGRHRRLALGFAAAGVLGVGLYVAVSMFLGDGSSLFFGGRLREPLGYANGQGGYFLLGFWFFVAVAELARRPLLAGLGISGASIAGCMLLVGQTRAVIPAVAISAAAILVLVPGRGRRLWVLILIGGLLAAISEPLLDVYRQTPGGDPGGLSAEVAKSAAKAMLLGAVALGVLWAGASYVISGPLRRHTQGQPAGALLPRVGTGLAVVIAVVAAITVTAVADPAERITNEYDRFVNLRLEGAHTNSRFFSGGGYRHDYWRIAWDQYKAEPLKGVGAGSYATGYFRERRTSEAVRQPHSLPLQTLSELGLIGGLALLLFVCSVLAGLWRHARGARGDPLERLVAVGGGGAFIAWLAHTSVDWLHIIPGVSGIALIAAAALVSPAVAPLRSGFRDRLRAAVTAAAALAVLVGAHTVARPAAANFLRVDAQDELPSDPARAVERANQALAVQGDSIRALYTRSAGYARLGEYRLARDSLREAARLEPHNHLPWALLGDLAARNGDLATARRDYRRASQLNPRDRGLEELASDPRIARTEGGR